MVNPTWLRLMRQREQKTAHQRILQSNPLQRTLLAAVIAKQLGWSVEKSFFGSISRNEEKTSFVQLRRREISVALSHPAMAEGDLQAILIGFRLSSPRGHPKIYPHSK